MGEFDLYLSLIENEDHAAYAQHVVANVLPEWWERQQALTAQKGGGWTTFLQHTEVGPGTAWPKISDAVQRHIEHDLMERRRFGERSTGFSHYRRHMEEQARRQEKRRETLKAQGGHFLRPRDSQRERLYSAERAALDPLVQMKWGERSVEEMQAWVDRLLGSAWWKRRWPQVKPGKVRVLDGSGHRRAMSYNNWRGRAIAMPLWARKDWVMLHELAHQVTSHNVAPHGREFARAYVEMVQHVMGKEAADALKRAFKANRVKYSKPRKMTEQQRQAASERLAAARRKP